MGIYLNPGGELFVMARQSPIYVDKTRLIAYLNSVLSTEQRFVCVSRPRRFGKSMAANMVSAYYDRTVDTKKVFDGLSISKNENFLQYAAKYNVIQLNMHDFLTNSSNMKDMLALLSKTIIWELLNEYPDIRYFDDSNLSRTMADIYQNTKQKFVIIIDEWDCIFRVHKEDKAWQTQYLDFLRAWLKDKPYVGLAYMTGILPIKKYGIHSALNMFTEFSMTFAGSLGEFFGFTEKEVKSLCTAYGMDFDECKAWYDGYRFAGIGSIYNPRSVVQSMLFHEYSTYWNQTETFEALKIYIDMDYEGLREAIIALMAGGQQHIDIHNFSNDMETFNDVDDILTLLVHLGYLGYDADGENVYVPNQEIRKEFANATKTGGWDIVANAISTRRQRHTTV